jgi:hypothetical protein
MKVASTLLAVVILIQPAVSAGVDPPFETPGANEFHCFEPYAWNNVPCPSVAGTGMDQQFDVIIHREQVLDCDPTCTLGCFGCALEDGAGVIYVDTHGSAGIFTVETYEKSEQGMAARDQAFLGYLDAGWQEGYIVCTCNAFCWGIAVTGFGVMSRFNDRNSIIYLSSCSSCDVAFGFDGAREILCYDDDISVIQGYLDADEFWSHMNGEVCRLCRTVGIASGVISAPFRHYQGPGTTVLSPAVRRMSLNDGDHIRTLTRERVVFDTRMDTSLMPVLETQGPIMVEETSWVDDTSMVFHVAPYDTAFGSLCVGADFARSSLGRILDGNQDPAQSTARGPSGDPHCAGLYAIPDDPATRWGPLWAFRSGAGVRVEWTTETERESDRFRVFAFHDEGPDLVAEVPARGSPGQPAFYSVDVPLSDGVFLVTEVDRRGVSTTSRSFPLSPAPPAGRDMAASLNHRPRDSASPPPSATDCDLQMWKGVSSPDLPAGTAWPDYVFYGPDTLLAEVGPVVIRWDTSGIESHLAVSTDSDPCALREYLRDLKAMADSLGQPRPAVILLGDANEGGEPEKNIVGTLYFEDSSGACYFSDFCSAEHDLADLDLDGLADFNLARIPADRRGEVARSAETFLNSLGGGYAPRALFLSGDVDEGNVLATSLHETVVGTREQYEVEGISTFLRRDSDYDWYDNETRQRDVANDMNGGVTEVFTMGAISNRLRTPGMFVQKVLYPQWDMDWLNSGPAPFVFWGPGCGMADIDRDNPAHDPVLAEMFLFNDPEKPSAVAWVSHGRGHWTSNHILFARELAHWRFSAFASDALDCFTRAKNSCVTKYPHTHDYVRSLCFLGWPAALPGMGLGSCQREVRDPATVVSLSCYPNPFNPVVRLHYTTARAGRVRLNVHDVTGRRVIRLVDESQGRGPHEATWDGRDARGSRVSSGIYFVSMRAGDSVQTVKVILAR